MKTTLWHTHDGGQASIDINEPVWLGADGAPQRRHQVNAIMIAPVRPIGDAVAVALVPPQLAGSVVHNSALAAAGMFALEHGDLIAINGRSCWLSIECEAEHSEYSPSKHVQDVYCFITKARLQEGEPITICPGRPAKPCGMIYKRAAWEMALEQAAVFKCPNCSFDPREPSWRPPATMKPTMLADLFQLLGQENSL